MLAPSLRSGFSFRFYVSCFIVFFFFYAPSFFDFAQDMFRQILLAITIIKKGRLIFGSPISALCFELNDPAHDH